MSAFYYGALTRHRMAYDPTASKDYTQAITEAINSSMIALDKSARDDFVVILADAKQKHDQQEQTTPAGSAKSYVDALAAIIPAEALVFYSVALPLATNVVKVDQQETLTIQSQSAVQAVLVFSVLLSLAFFLFGRGITDWERLDYLRAALPPIAAMLWLVLQNPSTMFLVFNQLDEALSRVVALFLAAVVGGLAAKLGIEAQNKVPKKTEGRTGN